MSITVRYNTNSNIDVIDGGRFELLVPLKTSNCFTSDPQRPAANNSVCRARRQQTMASNLPVNVKCITEQDLVGFTENGNRTKPEVFVFQDL